MFPIPGGLWLKLVVVAFAFTCGAFWGSHLENVRIQREERAASDARAEKQLDTSARQQAQNHEGLILWYRDEAKKARLLLDKEREATRLASKVYEGTIKAGEAELNKAKEIIDGLQGVNKVLAGVSVPDSGCVLDRGLRVTINAAISSINTSPAIGAAPAPTPRPGDGADPTNSVLTCGDLAASMIDILRHDRDIVSRLAEAKTWAAEISK